MIAPRLLPRTVQLCTHCQHNPAGFWVGRPGATLVRRPWCLACCAGLDRGHCTAVPFDAAQPTGRARRPGHDGAARRTPGRPGRHPVLRLQTVLTGRLRPVAEQLSHRRLS